jgi:hypothetical protein
MVKYGKSRLGFLELALAFKFLSNGLSATIAFAGRESVFWLFGCNFGTLAFYLFGKHYRMIVR